MDNVKFRIGDEEYEIPPIDDFDMDEWEIVYDYSGLVLDDFAPVEDETQEQARQRRTAQPALMRALLHIGYRRTHPEAAVADVKKITGAAKLARIFEVGDDAGPPDLTTAQESAPESSPSDSGSESSGSPVSSDEPESLPETTGTPV